MSIAMLPASFYDNVVRYETGVREKRSMNLTGRGY